MALRAHFDQATGMPGPQPFVAFRFFIYTDEQHPFVGFSHQVLVHAKAEETVTPIGAAYLAGVHRFERSEGGPGKHVTAVLPIDLATLRWLERQRAGHGGVTFYFDWNVLGHTDVADATPALESQTVSLAIGPTPFPVSLPQETWLEILRQVHYRDVAIIEIPLVADESNVMARAHEHLETARERLYRADDRGVLVACGEALDVLAYARRVKLSKEYGYEHLVQDLVAPIFDSDRKAERLGRVLTGVRQMCLSGKHDEAGLDGRPIPVNHDDAMLAFLMTSAAVSYLEQLPLDLDGNVPGLRSGVRRRSRRSRSSGEGTQAALQPSEPSTGLRLPAAPLVSPQLPRVDAALPASSGGAPAGPAPTRRRSRRSRSASSSGDGQPQPAPEGGGFRSEPQPANVFSQPQPQQSQLPRSQPAQQPAAQEQGQPSEGQQASSSEGSAASGSARRWRWRRPSRPDGAQAT